MAAAGVGGGAVVRTGFVSTVCTFGAGGAPAFMINVPLGATRCVD